MITDRDIWATAKMLVDQHGADAPIHAAARVDELHDLGDLDGRDVWRRILAAVHEMLRVPEPRVDDDLAALAAKLIEMFGNDAESYANARADALQARGRSEPAEVWRGLAVAVARLQRSVRGDQLH